MVCRAIGRHVHIAACQSEDARACSGSELQHISESESGEDGSSVDAISHSLYWRRTGIDALTCLTYQLPLVDTFFSRFQRSVLLALCYLD